MKNFSQFTKKAKKAFFIASCYPFVAFGADGTGNIASMIANSANEQIKESGTSAASVINTMSIVFGVIWLTVIGLTAMFNIEQLKQHSKQALGALVIIGIVYGLSKSAMS